MVLRGVSKSLKFMILDTTDLVKETIKHTNVDILYSKDVAKFTTMAAVLAQGLKSQKTKSSLILKGEGAISSIVAKSTQKGNIAVKVSINEEKHMELLESINRNDLEDMKKYYGLDGSKIEVTIDYGLKMPYNSIFIVQDGLLELAMRNYYEMSEQTQSILICSVTYNSDLTIKHSAGLLIQMLPDGKEEVLEWMAGKLERVASIAEMLDNDFSLRRVAYLLFEDDDKIFENPKRYEGLGYSQLPLKEDINILSLGAVKYECDCSYELMERALRSSLSKAEIDEIIEEDGFIQIECSFCNNKYKFDKID